MIYVLLVIIILMLFFWDFILFVHHKRISEKISLIHMITSSLRRQMGIDPGQEVDVYRMIKYLDEKIDRNKNSIEVMSAVRSLEIKCLKEENLSLLEIKDFLEEQVE